MLLTYESYNAPICFIMNMKVIDVFKGNNPWTKINLNKDEFFINDDWLFLSSHNRTVLKKYCSLPEPFSGDPNSIVICLNANPGEADRIYERLFGLGKYKRLTKETLEGKAKQSLWYDLKDHSGYCWLRNITKELRKDLNRNPNLFMIDYFPYHSPNTFNFPVNLPSYDFTNKLIKAAIDENKIIIILRQKEKWLKRITQILMEDKKKILLNHKQIIFVNSNQNICLSRKNLGEQNYNKVLLALYNSNIHYTFLGLFASFIEQRYGYRHEKSLDIASQFILSKKGGKLVLDEIDKYRKELIRMIDSNEIS